VRKGEQTRQRLVDAAAALLQTRGYYGTGINQVIAESGAPRGSLYFHFPGGKEELAASAVRSAGRRWQAALLEVFDAEPSLVAGVDAVCRYLADNLRDSGFDDGCPVATVALESAPTSQPLHEACAEVYADWQTYVSERLVAGGVDAERAADMATALVALVEGAVLLCKAHRSVEPLERVARQAAPLLAAPGGS